MDSETLSRVPKNTRVGLQAMSNLQTPKAEIARRANKAVELMREGMLVDDIAVILNVSPGRVTQMVLEFYPDDWKKAKTSANILRYERAQREFDNDGSDPEKPLDGVKLAYARERAKFAHLMLQSTNREMFGLREQAPVAGNVTIQIGIPGVEISTIQGEDQAANTLEHEPLKSE